MTGGPVYLVNAVVALAASALCLRHASPDRDRLALYGTTIVYGVLLEQLVILRFDAYRYPVDAYLLTVADVPVVIGLGWAAIIYSGLHIGRRLAVSRRRLPLFVGLYALHIDLTMDAVAIRVPLWTWTPPGLWFGVPLGNFMGWFLVTTLFSYAWLGLADRLSLRSLRGVMAMGVAIIGLDALLEVWTSVATTVLRKVVILGAVLGGATALVVRDGVSSGHIDWRISAVPFLYHGLFLSLLLGFGMYRDQPLLLPVSLTMIGIGVGLHGYDVRRYLTGYSSS